MIKQYIYTKRNGSNRKTGVLIGIKDESGDIVIGWSWCAKDDIFNKELGDNIAYHRAIFGTNKCVPYKLVPHLQPFADRCMRYFKTDCVVCFAHDCNIEFSNAKSE